jgi:hypothetical protein
MKILFLHGAYPFCYYYRGYLPGVYGNQMVVSDFMRIDAKVDESKLKAMADKADAIVFQRPTDRKFYDLAKAYKAKGKKIIFENDDTYSAVPLERLGNQKQVQIALEMNQNLNDFLALADGAIASTQVLADEFSKINPNIAVVGNAIDPLDEIPCKKNDTGKFRVGFIGSVTTNDDYFHLRDDIRKLDERGDITIVVMGVKFYDGTHLPIMNEDYEFWASLKNVEWHPYCHVTEYMMKVSKLALDLAIIPRKDHYFNKCKSNLKYLEMSLLKIPVLAQGFPNKDSPYEGAGNKHLTIAKDWYSDVIKIKDSYSKYKEKALKAHDFVLKHYNIKDYAPKWVNTIETLCKFQKKS